MTYSEIYNEVYGNDKTLEDLCLTPAHASAWNIIRLLQCRAGFEGWWENIGDENQNEIFARMVKTIQNNRV